MADTFFDGVEALLRQGVDAYGNIMLARAQAEAARNTYGGHGGGAGYWETNAYGAPEWVSNDGSAIDAPPVRATIPTWALVVAVGAVVYLVARR